MKKIINSLDGIRSAAISAVILTHIPAGIIYSGVPRFIHPLLDIIFGSGGVGVMLFFILTGFLMGYRHPQAVPVLDFYRRRYRRLFPAFLSVCGAIFLNRLFTPAQPVRLIGIILVLAFGVRLISEAGRRIGVSGRRFWNGWLIFQALVAVAYTALVIRVEPSVFLEVWDPRVRNAVAALVNLTLTLPFGQYIAQFDGVYWALAAEVIFYLAYPGILTVLKKFPPFQIRTLTGGILLLPFCYGLGILGSRLLGFSLVKAYLGVYFIYGAYLGLNYDFLIKRAERYRVFRSRWWWFALAGATFGHLWINPHLPKYMHPWLQTAMVIPISLWLWATVLPNGFGSRFFGYSFFRLVSRYSYMLFLVHSSVIHAWETKIKPESPADGVLMVAVVFISSFALAAVMYEIIEKNYFKSRLQKSSGLPESGRDTLSYRGVVGWMTVGVLGMAYLAFRPPVAMFTYVFRHQALPAWSSMRFREVTAWMIEKEFTAREDNLGMVTSCIRSRTDGLSGGGFVASKLGLSLRENDTQKYGSFFPAYQIIDSPYQPLGFPPIPGSKGRKYAIAYELDRPSPDRATEIIENEGILSVYFPGRRAIFAGLPEFAYWSALKLREPFTNPQFWVVFMYLAPGLVFVNSYSLFPKRRNLT